MIFVSVFSYFFFFFKQKTAYEMRISDCSSDVCSSDLDFPAYVSILLTGHIMAPIIIALVQETALSLAALAAIIVSSMLILMIGILQPAKGATIALQWWFGMHGFVKERGTSKEENPMPGHPGGNGKGLP